jgi:hypothetical protein
VFIAKNDILVSVSDTQRNIGLFFLSLSLTLPIHLDHDHPPVLSCHRSYSQVLLGTTSSAPWGSYYELYQVAGGITWKAADAYASAIPNGQLASLTTTLELSFVLGQLTDLTGRIAQFTMAQG